MTLYCLYCRKVSFSIAVCVLLAVAWPAQASFFDIFQETWAAAPPYPTGTPVRAYVLEDIGGGLVPLQTMSQGLFDAGAVGGSQYSTLCTGSDGNPEPSFIGPSSFFDIFLESATVPPPPETAVSSFFDVFTEISIGDSGLRGQLMPINFAYPSGDARRWIDVQYPGPDSFFDVFLEVALPEAPGAALRYHAAYRLSDEAVAAGGLFASPPIVQLRQGIDSFFDVFCEVGLAQSLPAGTKALTVTTTAALITGPVGTQSKTWGALKDLSR